MATRSLIGYWSEEKKVVVSAYCHWDGYPQGVGQTLLDNYRDLDTVKEVVSLGSFSSLKDTVQETRAEQHDKAFTSEDSFSRFIQRYPSNTEYHYLFIDGEWKVSAVFNKHCMDLKKVIENSEK